VLTRHRHAQRLLRPLAVVNPYAEQLTFLDDRTRTRRDHAKYLTLIEAIALLHQYQRPVKQIGSAGPSDARLVEYIEVELSDIALANRLAHEVLGRSLDELPPQTRRLLHLIDAWVGERSRAQGIERKAVRFTRRELREQIGWGDTQLKVHLARLEEMEFLIAHRAGHAQRHQYELAYAGEGRDGTPFLAGLFDVEKLAYDANRSGSNDDRSAPGRPVVGAWPAPGRQAQNPLSSLADGLSSESAPLNGQNVLFPEDSRTGSRSSSLAAALP
jgi:DNA primase